MATAAQRLVIFSVLYCAVAACVNGDSDAANHLDMRAPGMANSDELGQIITDQGELIMSFDDVVGIGEGLCDGEPCIRVFLARENAASIAQIHELLAGIPFAIDVSGEFIASPQ